MEQTLLSYLPEIVISILLIAFLFSSTFTIEQQNIGVITRFGKMQKTVPSGLNFKMPFIDTIDQVVSLQNRTTESEFSAITKDQANVHFNALLLYSVKDSSRETIEAVAFKFQSEKEFESALNRTIEGEVRAYVASKLQAEILLIRAEIVEHIKSKLDITLAEWGYHLLNLQMNDISFDEVIMESMARVVASANLRSAAENEGQALLITKTKAAEAEGNAIKISAEAEKQAATLRGQGIASFREEVAKGMKVAKEEMGDDSAVPAILFSMYMESMKDIAINGKGNVIYMDGSADGFRKTMQQIQGFELIAAKSNI